MPRNATTPRQCTRCQQWLPVESFDRLFDKQGKPNKYRETCHECRAQFWSNAAARTVPPPNPSGLCLCGCGQPTTIARGSDFARGRVKGEPVRYIIGHNGPDRSRPYYTVDPVTRCWVWQRRINADGYGEITAGGRSWKAHQWFYRQHHGAVPKGMDLDHLCRNRACVNPDHLEPVTKFVNCQRGRNAKLTPDDVRTIRSLSERMSARAIGRLFGVNKSSVLSVIHRRSWPNIE